MNVPNIIIACKNSLINKWHIFILTVLIGAILISHVLYVIKTYQFPHEDENVYLQFAVDFLPFLKEPTLNIWNNLLEITRYRQPLYPLILSTLFFLFGTTHAYKAALLLNGVFYAITILAVYLLARKLMDKMPSVLAAIIFSLYGFPLFYLHFTYSETAAAAFSTLALAFLVHTNNFSNTKNTAFFSITTSVAALIRWVAPIFLVGGLVFTLITAAKKAIIKKHDRKILLKNLLIFFTLGILPMFLLFYLPRLSSFTAYIESNLHYGPTWVSEPLQNTWSKSSLLWYINIFAQQTIFFFLLFLAGAAISILKFKKYGFLFIAFIVPYLIFTLGSAWKQDRFIVPIYPIMAVLSAVVFQTVKHAVLRRLLIFLTVSIGILNFLGGSWGIGPMKFSTTGNAFTVPHSILINMPIGHPRRVWFAPISWPPRQNEGNADRILETILKDSKEKKKPTLLLTFYVPQIEGPLYTTVLYEQRDLIDLRALWGFDANDYTTLFTRIKNADYILIKEKGVFDDQFDNQPDLLQTFNMTMRSPNAKLPTAFVKIKEIEIPFDKSSVIIYKKTHSITLEEWRSFTSLFLTANNAHAEFIQEATSTINK